MKDRIKYLINKGYKYEDIKESYELWLTMRDNYEFITDAYCERHQSAIMCELCGDCTYCDRIGFLMGIGYDTITVCVNCSFPKELIWVKVADYGNELDIIKLLKVWKKLNK